MRGGKGEGEDQLKRMFPAGREEPHHSSDPPDRHPNSSGL